MQDTELEQNFHERRLLRDLPPPREPLRQQDAVGLEPFGLDDFLNRRDAG